MSTQWPNTSRWVSHRFPRSPLCSLKTCHPLSASPSPLLLVCSQLQSLVSNPCASPQSGTISQIRTLNLFTQMWSPSCPRVSNIRMIMRTRKRERLAFCPSLNYKMAIVSLGDVIGKLVWRPETITDGITLELPEMQQVQPFQQQWASLTLHPRKDRDQWDRQGSLLLSDEGDSWQERVPVGFTSQTNKRDFFFFCLLHLSRFSPSSFFFFQRKGIGPL